jgi:hypothetical protein
METFYRSCTGTLLEEKREEKRREAYLCGKTTTAIVKLPCGKRLATSLDNKP